MEILLKKSKITASILKQTVGAFVSDLKDSNVLGWCIFNKCKYIVLYNEKNNRLTKQLYYRDVQVEVETNQIDYGIEKTVFKPFDSPYLVGGCIYVLNNNYYNIETNEFYCRAFIRIESERFVFLDNKYDKDLSKQGVMKINKLYGTYEIIK